MKKFQPPTYPHSFPKGTSPDFMAALREDSNLEMDWLWRAQQMTQPEERRYCFQRALYISPRSEAARRGLEEMGDAVPQARPQRSGVIEALLRMLAKRASA